MKPKRSPCPLASALDIIGDKWTLLVVRDLLAGKTAYSEFLESPEKISTNILAARLKLLESQKLIKRSHNNPRTGKAVYQLTPKGESLYSVLNTVANWGLDNIAGTRKLINV